MIQGHRYLHYPWQPTAFASDESLVVCQELRLGPSTTTELAATVVDAIDNFVTPNAATANSVTSAYSIPQLLA